VQLVDGGQCSIENLKVGDRLWSLNPKSNALVKDEVIMMMYSESDEAGKLHVCFDSVRIRVCSISLALFYTIKSTEGYQISLTGQHMVPVMDIETNAVEILQASQMTLKHRLITWNRTMTIESIFVKTLFGRYSPLTLSGYVFVNNISASAFSNR
jgi:hypothetical protein